MFLPWNFSLEKFPLKNYFYLVFLCANDINEVIKKEVSFYTLANLVDKMAFASNRPEKAVTNNYRSLLTDFFSSKCQWMGDTMDLVCDHQECLINSTLVNLVNNQWNRFGWRARNYSEFWGRHLSDGINLRLGTILSARKVSLK